MKLFYSDIPSSRIGLIVKTQDVEEGELFRWPFDYPCWTFIRVGDDQYFHTSPEGVVTNPCKLYTKNFFASYSEFYNLEVEIVE
jgi:hypothetical protein